MRRQPMQVGSQFSGTHKADDRYIGSLYKKYNLDRLIRLIFANGEQGFAYDPNDLTTLFQDAAGTIPVTSTGQPVGMMLDKSKGLLLGAELFNDATVVLSGGVARESSGVYLIDTPDTIQYIGLPLPIKGRYLLDFEILSLDYGTLRIDATGSLSSYRYNSTGRFIQYVSHLRDLSFIAIARDSSPTKARIRVNSIRQVLGNHAYQTVSASRPVLRQTPILGNELVVNGDFSNGLTGWGTVSANALVQAGSCVVTATGAGSRIGQTLNTVVGKTYKVSFTSLSDAFTLDARAGTYPAAMGATLSSVNTLQTGGYSLQFTATTTTTSIYTNSYVGAGYSYSIDNISVKEVLGYRTDQNYLEFDGVDDFLTTNAINFTATDKVSVFTGLRKLSDAAQGSVVELGRGVFLETSGSFIVNAPASAGVAGYKTFVQGGSASTLAAETSATFPAPISNVLTMRADIANKISKLNVNGIDVSATTGAVLNGNFGNYPLYIGRRAGQYIPFSGNLYGLIGVGRLTTGDEALAVERELAKATGVTLNV